MLYVTQLNLKKKQTPPSKSTNGLDGFTGISYKILMKK